MMTPLHSCLVAVLAAGQSSVSAAPPDAETQPIVAQLSRSAEQELAESIAQLNTLREQIAAEKLPLAQELATLEEQLSELRRTHDATTRQVDQGNLELASIKTEMKARQDELTYIGSLLDEYARTFETKVHVSELQQSGESIEAAKQASENTALSVDEKFDRQIALVEHSRARLAEVIGGMRFPGVGVDLDGTLAKGQFAIIGPVALFSAGAGGASGVVVPQSGSTKPLIRPLEGAMQAGLASLVQSGEGILPLDPSRGAALAALVQKTNLIHIFKKGGPIMWPLLFASILALGAVIERMIFLMLERLRRDPKAVEQFFAAVTRGDLQEAARIGAASKFHVVRALGYALSHKETSLANALLYAQARELKRYQRGIPVLDTVITLAPLLGLLGTVTGMMGSFSIIGGDLSSPGAITGGIAEALIATAFGLGIAITALLPFNLLNTRQEQARHEIESAATQLELLVEPRAAASRLASTPTARGNDADHADDDADLREREIRRRRDELRRQVAELKLELDEQELKFTTLSHRERSSRQPVAAKD